MASFTAGMFQELYTELYIYRILLILFFVLLAFFTYSYINTYYGIWKEEGVIRHGNKKKKNIALTFDDGPSPKFTPKILDILKKHHVKATFFLIGKHADKYPDIVKRIHQEGHDIGNHTYTHAQLSFSSVARVLYEVNRTRDSIERIIGVRPLYFRPPRGIYTQNTRRILVDKGYIIVLWTISSIDWRLQNPKKIVKRVEKFTRPGDIILMHDSGAIMRSEGGNRYPTIKALPDVIRHLKKEGYSFKKISEMIEEMD